MQIPSPADYCKNLRKLVLQKTAGNVTQGGSVVKTVMSMSVVNDTQKRE